jgi:hypothetical protein
MPTQWMISAISVGSNRGGNDVTVDDVFYACHHLVECREVIDRFQFSHFSVQEFFTERAKTNPEFDSDQLYLEHIDVFTQAICEKRALDSKYWDGKKFL